MMLPNVLAIVQLPPPVSGLSAVNAVMVDKLSEAGMLWRAVDVAPGGGKRGLSKLIRRSARTVAAICAMVVARWRGVRTVYMPSDGGFGIIFNVVLALFARLMGFDLWIHHHSFSYINSRSTLMSLLIIISPRNAKHILLCDSMRDSIANVYSREWIQRGSVGFVLPNAFLIEMSCDLNKINDLLTIGHLSNLTKEKGSVRFIDLFLALKMDGVPVKARIAGPIGDEETEVSIANAQALWPGDFEWLGPVYGVEKDRFFDSLDVFIFPSEYENEAQPLVLLEALARGAAIVTTRRGCMFCDHEDSPGVTASEDGFQEAALIWLKEHVSAADRVGLPEAARSRLSQMRLEAEASLAGILKSMHSG